MIIIRPGIDEFSIASFIVLFSTFLWALAAVVIKKLSDTESPEAITFYMTLFITPLALPLAIIFWQDVRPSDFIWFAFIGLTANLSHLALNKALSKAELTAILPFDFIRLIFIGILAYVIFGDKTNIYDVIGAAVIIFSSIYIARRTTKQSRKIQEESLQAEI